jgi:cytochrome b561/polyisoprenoid-binding protein YceI
MSPIRYSRAAMILHWLIALALAFQLALGFQLEDIPRGTGQFAAYQFHKSVGITILLLTLARLAVRLLRQRPPSLPDAMWATRAATIVHGLLYAFMIGAPLTGWLLVSTAKIKVPTLLFGSIPLPHLPAPQTWGGFAHESHELLAFLGIGLFVLHVGGAMRHQFVKGEPLLQRMLPVLSRGRGSSMAMAGLSLAAVGLAFAGGWWLNWQNPNSKAPAGTPTPMAQVAEAPKLAVPNEPAELSTDSVEEKVATNEPIEWAVSPGGKLGFTARWSDTPINGTFSRWDADIRFNPESLDTTDIRIEVDLASANTGDSQRDEMLRGDAFFDVATHPKAVFTTRSAKKVGTNRYVANGALSLHGQKRPITLSFTLKIESGRATVRGTAQLARTQFGVGSGEWEETDQIADPVSIAFNFAARALVRR